MTEKWNIYKKKWMGLWEKFFLTCYLPSVGCYIFVELCSRKSVLDLALFFIQQPLVFFYNAFIIAVTASVCLLFRRRTFVLSVVLFLWAAVGVTDMVLLSFRTTPFTAVDLLLIQNALQIADRYLSPLVIGLIAVAIVGVLLICVYLFRKVKKEEPVEVLWGVPFCGLLLGLCLVLTDGGMAAGLLDRNFGNLAQAFHDNGLPYCFMNSVLNTGIERPDNYSAEVMGELVAELEEDVPEITTVPEVTKLPVPTRIPEVSPVTTPEPTMTLQPTKHPEVTLTPEPTKQPAEMILPESSGDTQYPNIIFLQLESFFDVKLIENASYTADPIPFFTYLKEHYPSGYLEVPSIGAGTANTEFECITGMNLDLFGPGEYPYKTILKERTCESMAYIMKKFGFSASAIHNNDGTFYSRNQVFANLGFDRYTSIEYMADAPVNELNWAKDRVLTGEIMKILRGTKERDYIYTISVQGHGAYPAEPIGTKLIDVKLPEELSEYYYQYVYYVNQLFEMDQFLKELILNLTAWKEEVVLVLYGDHLPSLGLSEEYLKNGNLFQTEYVIWSNYGLSAEDKDLQSYQLTARLCELLGIEEGIMPQYHLNAQADSDYLENMQLLMYDMLYGKMEVYEGKSPYEPTTLQMGMKEICIRDVYLVESLREEQTAMLYVTGDHFTEWSKVAINGEAVETIYLNERLLAVPWAPEGEEDYSVTVRQQGNDEFVLSETEAKYVIME